MRMLDGEALASRSGNAAEDRSSIRSALVAARRGRVRRRTLPTERLGRSFEHPGRAPSLGAIGYHCVSRASLSALTSLATAPRGAEARYRCRSHAACPRGSGSGWDYSASGRPRRHTAPAHGAAEGFRPRSSRTFQGTFQCSTTPSLAERGSIVTSVCRFSSVVGRP